ncbi:MAG: protein phosphatase 2C domain-containing protein [Ilumatobacter sp.]
MAELTWGAGTHTGQVRPANEDHLHASNGVYVVADGMGGHEAGEVASELAVERIRDVLLAEDLAPTAERVVEAISDANGDIFRAAIATPGQAGMGTTVTVIAVIEDPMAGRGAPNIDDNDGVEADRVTPIIPLEQPEALVLANVGDSRTYLYRHNRLRRVTVDHSYVQELVATGHITDDEARTHPRRNIITRALGIEPDVKVDWWTLPLVRGDRFLLCSDGLVDEVPDADITHVLSTNEDPQTAVDLLIAMANAAGGRDNITVIVVDVMEGDDPPDPTQELDLTPVWADDPDITLDDIRRIEAGELEIGSSVRASTEDEVAAKRTRRQRRRDRKSERSNDVDSETASSLAARAVLKDGDDTDASETDTSETDTSDSDASAANAPVETRGAPKRPRLSRAIGVFVVIALLIAGFVAFAAWARRGYFVDFDTEDRVTVFQGKPGGVLWFDQTTANRGTLTRADMSADGIESVEDQPSFSSLADAVMFVRELPRDAPDGDAPSDNEPEPDAAGAP